MTKYRALTPEQIAKAPAKATTLTDGAGLSLKRRAGRVVWVWTMAYGIPGTDKRDALPLGHYPDMTIDAARAEAEAIRRQLSAGLNPRTVRDQGKAAAVAALAAPKVETTVRAVAVRALALKWLPLSERPAKYIPAWSDHRAREYTNLLAKHVHPHLGDKECAAVTTVDVMSVLRRLIAEGKVPTARTALKFLRLVFALARAEGHTRDNPTADIEDLLTLATVPTPLAALTAPKDIGELARRIAAIEAGDIRGCLTAFMHTAQRGANVRTMQWAHLDLDAAEWTIPSPEMKRSQERKIKGDAHVVPLSRQLVAELRARFAEVRKDANGVPVCPYVWGGSSREHSSAHLPMEETRIRKALLSLGFGNRQTLHGFRAMFRTVASEVLNVPTKVLECQLAHGNGEPLGAAYARETWLVQRGEAARQWGDWLDAQRAGAQVHELLAA